ncbi:MAG: EamA/RhaT family transporter [Gammaproteobacteria bacterium]|nr:MAG: EamA/RhaT family transporter [Gammaproteobacteria bacterium]
MQPARIGLIQINIAVILLGGTTLFAKLVELPPPTIVMFRGVFGAAALLLIIKLLRQTVLLKDAVKYATVIVSGLLMGVHWVTFFHSIQVTSVAIGIVSMYTFPVITSFIEPLVNREKLRLADIISAFIVLLGIYFILPKIDLSNQVVQGVLWGVFSAFLLSCRNIVVRKSLGDIPGTVIMFYQLLITALILLPFADYSHELFEKNHMQLLVLLGIVFTALPHTLFVSSLKHLRATSASLISCMQPMYSTLLAFLVLGDKPEGGVILGGLLVVGAAVYESAKNLFSVDNSK